MKVIKICFFMLLTFFIEAQSITELVEILEENNLSLKILESEYQSALQVEKQMSQLPDPEVGIGAFPLPVETRLGAQVARISASQMIPWPGTLKKKAEVEHAKAIALKEKIDVKKLQLRSTIRIPYYQLYKIQETQVILKRNLIIFESLERLTLIKVESGTANASDVLRVQLKIEELKQELLILEQTKKVPLATINQLLNRKLDINISTSEKLAFIENNYTKEAISDQIKKTHPTLLLYEKQQEISNRIIELNEINGKPTFGAGLDYIMIAGRTDIDPPKNGRDIIQLRASIKIPLQRGKYQAKTREENIKKETIDLKKENILTQYKLIVEKAFAKHETSKLRTTLYKKQIKITTAAIQILQSNYSASGNNFNELLRLEKELIDYDLKLLQAIIDSHLAINQIESILF